VTDDRTPGYDEPDFDRLDTSPISLAEWDYLVTNEQNETAEPFEGRA
jgi:hypothetical protein